MRCKAGRQTRGPRQRGPTSVRHLGLQQQPERGELRAALLAVLPRPRSRRHLARLQRQA